MEEKIIDGINIAECEFAIKPINDNRIKCHCVKGLLQISKMQEQPESIKGSLCENNPNCYYKQLKRLEQENENLKQQLEIDKNQINYFIEENEELKEQNKKHSAINEQETKDYAELIGKYNKMVEISKENLIKYEDLRIDNQKLIIEIENLNSQIDFEAQKQAILLQENKELKDRVKGEIHLGNNYKKDFAEQVQIAEKYKTALEEIKAELKDDLTCESRECGCDDYGECLECLKETILNIITEAIGE